MGRLLGVLYMDNKGAGAGQGTGADASKQLGNWFRDTGFPGFFRVSVPDAKILREVPGEIGGQPAWIDLTFTASGALARQADHLFERDWYIARGRVPRIVCIGARLS